MINNVGLYNYNTQVNSTSKKGSGPVMPKISCLSYALNNTGLNNEPNFAVNKVATKLSGAEETKMYNEVLDAFATSISEKTSPKDNVLRQKKLDSLLKSGKLLNRNSNDNSSTLESIYKIITTPRAANLDGIKLAGEIIDTIYSPASITQKFGDIPSQAQGYISDGNTAEKASKIKTEGSGTCVAASVEFHLANKMPSEFARWAEGLTSPKIQVEKNLPLNALSSNKMNALWLLKEFETPIKSLDFNSANIVLKPDEQTLTKALIQDNYWDSDERTVIDVLMQSTLMNTGSQQTYNSLIDERAGKFNANPQGLIEFEKTYIESLVDGKERDSVIYQNVDDNQILKGWNTDLSKIQGDITKAVDNGEDVIIGYVVTAKECNEKGCDPNKIVNGHEITIVDYKKDSFGNIKFICNDTDDDKPHLIEYDANYLLPKIHHASYPVSLIQNSAA